MKHVSGKELATTVRQVLGHTKLGIDSSTEDILVVDDEEQIHPI